MPVHNEIAIIGVDGVFPEAETLEALYENLRGGRDSVREISDNRKIYACLDPSLDYRIYGALDRVDEFDYKFFNISRYEADRTDPQQRLLLQVACGAIENAGYSLNHLNGTRTGVYVGATDPTYRALLEEDDFITFTGNMKAMIAARISYLLNLHGPALVIDTACASSLVAVIEACQGLLSGAIDYALAGGVSINSSLHARNRGTNFDSIIAADGKCKAFDTAADGMTGGEGAGVIVLKRLADALRDQDHVHAVIKGFATNQDGGRTVGITAPSPVAQAEVLVEAWRRAGIDPESVTYIEAHGTGTKLGDPIEVRGMTDAFARFTGRKHFCGISSLKSNIGHLDAAARIAGVIKVILSLRHRELFPSLHFHTPNPLIDFDNSAVYVNDRLRNWDAGDAPRRAGVSAFGLSGTNAHLVLEEMPTPAPAADAPAGEVLVTLSAKTPTALRRYLVRLQQYLVGASDTGLASLSYTLNAGRSDYAWRHAWVVRSKAELLACLADTLAGEDFAETQLKKGDAQSLVLLFPAAGPCDGATISDLRARHEAFDNGWQACAAHADLGGSNAAVKQFAFQYGLYCLLQSLGVVTENTIGIGVGNLVVAVVTGRLSLQQGLGKAAGYVDDGRQPDAEKMGKYLQQFKYPVCLEVGCRGVLSELVATLQGEAFGMLPITGAYTNPSEAAAALYKMGVPIDWNTYYGGKAFPRVPLPTYPFDKTRAWISEPLGSLESDVAACFYGMEWTKVRSHPPAPLAPGKHWLVFMDEEGIGGELCARLRQESNRVTTVYLRDEYRVLAPDSYAVRATVEQDYRELLKSLIQGQNLPEGIVHLGNCDRQQSLTRKRMDALLDRGLYSQFLAAHVFDPVLAGEKMDVILVSTHAFDVSGEDATVNPAKAASFGFLKGLMAEYATLRAKSIDLTFGRGQGARELANHVLNELGYDDYCLVAYRSNSRYIQSLTRLEAAQPLASTPVPMVNNGVYLVTGGASGIGYEVCKSLAARGPIRLLVVGRTALPPRSEWSRPPEATGNGAQRTKNLNALLEAGADVYYYSCDLSLAEQTEALYRQLTREHGRINGIVHSAALPGTKRIKHNTLPEFREIFGSRVGGAISLVELSAAQPPDFVVIFSSIAVLQPAEVRKSDYAAGCVMMEQYIQDRSKFQPNLKVIHWCDWQETGMSYRLALEQPGQADQKQFLRVSTLEGLRIFNRLLSADAVSVIPFANAQYISPLEIGFLKDNPYFSARQVLDEYNIAATARTATPAYPAPGEAADGTAPVLDNQAATPTEETVAAIWQEVLRADTIALTDDFFDLGGQSLNGFNMLTRVEQKLNVALEIDDLYEYGTLKDFSAHIDRLLKSTRHAKLYLPIPAAPVAADYPASNAQQRVWMANQLDSERSAYNISEATLLEGRLQQEAFEEAYRELLRRHESLRTTFVLAGGELRQKVHPFDAQTVGITRVDLRREANPEETARNRANRESVIPFDLEKGPLVRAKLLLLADHKYAFLLTLHHIVADGWSMGVLLKDFIALYNAFSAGKDNPLPPLRIQYKDFTLWQQRQLSGENQRIHRDYWMARFEDPVPLLLLPTDFLRPARKTTAGNILVFEIGGPAFQGINELGRKHQISTFTVLLALAKTFLHRHTGQSDITVIAPIFGRDHVDLENQIGLYLNMLALRTRFDPDDDFQSLFQKVKTTVLGAYKHQLYPFDQLIKDLAPSHDPSRSPLSDVWVQFEEQHTIVSRETEYSALQYRDLEKDHLTAKVDLTFNFVLLSDGIRVIIGYNTDLFREATIEAFKTNFLRIVALAVAASPAPLGEIPMLDAEGEQEEADFIRLMHQL